MIRVAICDDHDVALEGISLTVQRAGGMVVVATCKSGEVLLDELHKTPADVVLLDFHMTEMNGIETLKHCMEQHPDLKVVVLSVDERPEIVRSAFEAGAVGYVTKASPGSRIIKAIESVFRGDQYLDPDIGELPVIPVLTKKEMMVLTRLGGGKSPKEIAREMGVTSRSIYNHQQTMAKKLRVTTEQIVMKAFELGILSPEDIGVKE